MFDVSRWNSSTDLDLLYESARETMETSSGCPREWRSSDFACRRGFLWRGAVCIVRERPNTSAGNIPIHCNDIPNDFATRHQSEWSNDENGNLQPSTRNPLAGSRDANDNRWLVMARSFFLLRGNSSIATRHVAREKLLVEQDTGLFTTTNLGKNVSGKWFSIGKLSPSLFTSFSFPTRFPLLSERIQISLSPTVNSSLVDLHFEPVLRQRSPSNRLSPSRPP